MASRIRCFPLVPDFNASLVVGMAMLDSGSLVPSPAAGQGDVRPQERAVGAVEHNAAGLLVSAFSGGVPGTLSSVHVSLHLGKDAARAVAQRRSNGVEPATRGGRAG